MNGGVRLFVVTLLIFFCFDLNCQLSLSRVFYVFGCQWTDVVVPHYTCCFDQYLLMWVGRLTYQSVFL